MQRLLQVFNIFKVRDEGNAEFWISNVVIMASTILGVYLAASAGYRTALDFEVARSERDGYYMRRALLDEVKDNLDAVDGWTKDFEKALRTTISESYFLPGDSWVTYWSDKGGWSNSHMKPDQLHMTTYVWETMKQQTITFQLTPEILSAVRRYYDAMDGNMKDMVSEDWKAARAAKAILEDTKRMREEILPVFEKDIAKLHNSLAQKGVAAD
jgi:hypothetical protein